MTNNAFIQRADKVKGFVSISSYFENVSICQSFVSKSGKHLRDGEPDVVVATVSHGVAAGLLLR